MGLNRDFYLNNNFIKLKMVYDRKDKSVYSKLTFLDTILAGNITFSVTVIRKDFCGIIWIMFH
jgi:hypothetical protein